MKIRIRIKDEVLDRIRNLMGIGDTQDILNQSLLLFDWAVDAVSTGKKIAAIDEEACTYQVIESPGLGAVMRADNEQ